MLLFCLVPCRPSDIDPHVGTLSHVGVASIFATGRMVTISVRRGRTRPSRVRRANVTDRSGGSAVSPRISMKNSPRRSEHETLPRSFSSRPVRGGSPDALKERDR
jgi:hypothetical protein